MRVSQVLSGPGFRTTALDFRLFSTDTEPLLSIKAGIPADVALSTVHALCELAGDLQYEITEERATVEGNELTMHWWLSIAQAILASLHKGVEPNAPSI